MTSRLTPEIATALTAFQEIKSNKTHDEPGTRYDHCISKYGEAWEAQCHQEQEAPRHVFKVRRCEDKKRHEKADTSGLNLGPSCTGRPGRNRKPKPETGN